MVNENSFISINEVLADVTVALDDQEERLLNHGFYVAQVRNAIDELGFDTVFYEDHADREIPANNIIVVPSNVYRIKNLHLFTGAPDNIESTANLYWKKGARDLGGKDRGYTANFYPGIDDLYYGNSFSSAETAYWFKFHNGNIILSDGCTSWDYIRIVYDGIPSNSNLSEANMIPPEVRKALVLWAIEKCSGTLKVRDAKYRTIQLDAARDLDEYGQRGAWHEAKMRLKYMGKKFLRDTLHYSDRPHAG
jgi:hypothetical protein